MDSRYEDWQLLGEGNTGKVYLAFDRKEQRDVAIKVSNYERLAKNEGWTLEEAIDQLKTEVQALTELDTWTPQLYDHWDDGENMYIVEEYICGVSLKEVFDAENIGSPSRVWACLGQLIEAAVYINEKGWFHTDLAANNAIWTGLRVKVIDFGSARRTDPDSVGDSDSILDIISDWLVELDRIGTEDRAVERLRQRFSDLVTDQYTTIAELWAMYKTVK